MRLSYAPHPVMDETEPAEHKPRAVRKQVIASLFANDYLHCGVDLGADRWRRSEAAGDMIRG